MPPGLLGLIVAAIVAATMSTHSGAINSLAAATTHDIYLPLTKLSPDDPQRAAHLARTRVMWGVMLTGGALLFHAQGTPVVVVALVDRDLHLRRAARRLLSRNPLAARDSARRDPRHDRGDRRNGYRRFRKAARRGISVAGHIARPLARIAWPWYVLIGTTITVVDWNALVAVASDVVTVQEAGA